MKLTPFCHRNTDWSPSHLLSLCSHCHLQLSLLLSLDQQEIRNGDELSVYLRESQEAYLGRESCWQAAIPIWRPLNALLISCVFPIMSHFTAEGAILLANEAAQPDTQLLVVWSCTTHACA